MLQDHTEGHDPQELRSFLGSMMRGFMLTQLLSVACQLGLADFMSDGPKSAEALAQATKMQAPLLRRALRALAAHGVFTEIESDCFALTQVGALLKTGAPGSVRNWAILFGSEPTWRIWLELIHTLRTGEDGYHHLFGIGAFQNMASSPERAALFNAAMADMTRGIVTAAVSGYDFSSYRTILDIGGGTGTLLAAILKANPTARGILFDIPSAMEAAGQLLAEAGLTNRCERVSGDFFKSVPGGADAYLLKSVIHDWDDDHCISILRNCRRAIPGHGKLLLLERVLPGRVETSSEHREALMLDMHMMVATGERERTEAEFKMLYEAAGFQLKELVPLGAASFFVIVGVPG